MTKARIDASKWQARLLRKASKSSDKSDNQQPGEPSFLPFWPAVSHLFRLIPVLVLLLYLAQ